MNEFVRLMQSYGLKYEIITEGPLLVPGATHAVKVGIQAYVFNEDTFLALRVSLS